MRRKLTWLFAVMGVVMGAIALNAAPGAATQSSGFSSVSLARGTNHSSGTLPLQDGTDIVMSQNTFQPSGSSGWHAHPGGAIVVVKQGQITLYRSRGSQCDATTYSAGEAFLEQPGEAVDAVNTGSIPTVVFVTFPRVPQGAAPRIDLRDPGTCPGL